MQSPSIQDFPLNPKRRLELQNQHISQLQQLQQQQNCDDMMICDNEGPPFKKQRPGVATNFLYKFAEFAAYTSAFASEAINTITGGHVGKEQHSIRQNYYYDDDDGDDDVLQIKTDDENEEEDLCDQKLDKKDESSTWVENVEDEEPPPPYDSSWTMPSPSTSNDKMPVMITTPALSSSPSQQELATSQKSSNLQQIVTKSTARRRQFRVRRGRRFSRRKSSSTDMSSNANNNNTSSGQPEGDEEDIFLKFNCKLTDMIAEGKAALTSKVNVTDVEMMLAEEKEREERIMKELGIQTPINRRARRLTGSSSTSSDYEFYNSLLGPGGYSNQSNNSLYDSGFSGGSNCYSSPTGSYSVDNGFVTNRPVIGRSSPTQYGSSGFNSPVGHGFGSPSTFSPTTPTTASGYEMFNSFGQNSSKYGSGSGFGSNGMYNSRSYF